MAPIGCGSVLSSRCGRGRRSSSRDCTEPGGGRVNWGSGVAEDVVPVGAEGFDAELGDQAAEDGERGDDAGRNMRFSQVESGVPSTDVKVWRGDLAQAVRVPVKGEDLVVFVVEKFVAVALRAGSPVFGPIIQVEFVIVVEREEERRFCP